MPLLGYFSNWPFQTAVFSFPIISVIPAFKTYYAQLLQDHASAPLTPPTSTGSGPATLLSSGANTMILLPAGHQGQGVLSDPSTFLNFLFGCLRSALDTGSRRSLHSSKGSHCHFSLCAPLFTLGRDHSTKDIQSKENAEFTSIFIA